jgi:hypothetical protein
VHDCDYNALCVDAIEGWTCTCKEGWFGNGKVCDDVDVCAGGTHGCGAHSACVNGAGLSYECVCDTGYAPDSNGSCVDINECDAGSSGRRRRDILSSGVESDAPPVGCAPNSICTNTEGSFYCECESMYRDESIDNDGSLCKGPYCKAEYVSMVGYDDIRMVDENDNVCYDIDECEHELDNCHKHAKCTNTIASFTCECDLPWKGDGTSCFKKHNTWRLDQLETRIRKFIPLHFEQSYPRFSARMVTRFNTIMKKLDDMYERRVAECDLPEEEGELDPTQMDDPCRGSKQLTQNIATWAQKWTIPCGKRAHRDPVFADRITRWMDKIQGKLQEKAEC